MSIIVDKLSEVGLGQPQQHRNLTMFPLLAGGAAVPGYRLLDDALASGTAHITEVSDSGSVPELKFINEGDLPVLLLDGEELVGAKQNRILNLTVLAPANQTIVIPVSCVESGRWRSDSAEFSSARRAHYAAGRASKAAQVTHYMRATGSRRSDQGAVWEDIAEKSQRMQAHSGTGAAAAMYETHRSNLDDFLGAFSAVNGQAGALFAVNGAASGFDLFDCHVTLATVLGKLVESYALDAIDSGSAGSTDITEADPQTLLDDASNALVRRFPAVGEGEDVRLEGEHLSGGALVKEGQVIHLCAFRVGMTGRPGRMRRSRMARSSRRAGRRPTE